MKILSALMLTIALTAAATWTVHSMAQSPIDDSASTLPAPKKPRAFEVPDSALLTERGRQLAHELRMLQFNRDSMGEKHPSLPDVDAKIQAVQESLAAWEPSFADPAVNPFRQIDASGKITEVDMRQLVIQMSKRIDQLEKRVELLERP